MKTEPTSQTVATSEPTAQITLDPADWVGNWENFELWLDSKNPNLVSAWEGVERAIADGSLPSRAASIFGDNPREFWRPTVTTIANGNTARLSAWHIEANCDTKTLETATTSSDMTSLDSSNKDDEDEPQTIRITWLAEDGSDLGSAQYGLDHVIERGLEGKPSLLLRAVDTTIKLPDANAISRTDTNHTPTTDTGTADAAAWPFRWLLTMEPMPDRRERENGGLLAHTHFQFAAQADGIVTTEDTLTNPRWYATMCDEARNDAERIQMIRAVHGLKH